MTRFTPAVLALVLALAASAVSAQDSARLEVISFSEQPGLISVTVTGFGPQGQPLSSISPGSVKATLGGQQLSVSSVQANTRARPPLAVALMVDTSGSMYGEPITQATRALTEFVQALVPDDQVAVMHFETTVRTLQDFTADKGIATAAINRLTPFGDTALYDAVIEASRKITSAPAGQKMVVLLSDGVANINTSAREASLEQARESGVTFIVIGFGNSLDRPYLAQLAESTGGLFLETPNTASLRQAYSNIAAAIRTNYIINLRVPDDIDRTVSAELVMQVVTGTETPTVRLTLPPLEGALPPPFNVEVEGLQSGASIRDATNVRAVIPEAVRPAAVEYTLDGQTIYSGPVADGVAIDPLSLTPGAHLLKVVVVDDRGGRGEKQLAFETVVPAAPGGLPSPPLFLLLALPLLLLGGAAALLFLRGRHQSPDSVVTRVKPWRGRVPDVTSPMATPPGEWQVKELPPAPPAMNRPLGRVIIMDEQALRGGSLDAIREYEIGSSPLTLGTTSSCDIIIEDPEGRIAGEEARLWVQRGRLVYHKLSTLSAMATEGVTSGWQFLENGEDISVGPYRLSFALDVRERQPEPQAQPESSTKLRELFPLADGPEPLAASSDYAN